jgi:hypothetical protein
MAMPAAWIGNDFASWAIHEAGSSSIITMIPNTLDLFLMPILDSIATWQSILQKQIRR